MDHDILSIPELVDSLFAGHPGRPKYLGIHPKQYVKYWTSPCWLGLLK